MTLVCGFDPKTYSSVFLSEMAEVRFTEWSEKVRNAVIGLGVGNISMN
jgi:hypothetical protein